MKVPTQRYMKDVAGMPCYAAASLFAVHVGADAMAGSVPRDDENCAIAKGCRTQLNTPYVSVGRRRTQLALPHPKGVIKEGHGNTRWAVYQFENPASAVRIVVAADTGQLGQEAVLIELRPPRPSDRPPARRRSGKQNPKTTKPKRRGQDNLTLMGVRNLNGHRRW